MEKTYMDERMLLDGLFAFLDQSVSPFHGAAAACRLLEKAGYTLCPESQPWKLEAGGRYYTTRNGTAVLAWRMPRGRLACDGQPRRFAHLAAQGGRHCGRGLPQG